MSWGVLAGTNSIDDEGRVLEFLRTEHSLGSKFLEWEGE